MRLQMLAALKQAQDLAESEWIGCRGQPGVHSRRLQLRARIRILDQAIRKGYRLEK